jgi:hypothetical protein
MVEGAAEATLDTLPNEIIQMILSMGHPILMCRAREVCRLFRWLLPRPQKITPDGLLREGARLENEDVCLFAKEHGATAFNEMLKRSTIDGSLPMCLLALKFGASNVNEMARCACSTGHLHLCRLAKDYGATEFDQILAAAAYEGDIDLCVLAKSWGATNYLLMAVSALLACRDDMIALAVKWSSDA